MILSKEVKLYIIHVITPLIVGGCIYVIFRNNNLRFFNWFEKIAINDYISTIRLTTNPYKNLIPDGFYNSLPDGLWVYSFTSFYVIMWKKQIDIMRYWLILPLIFGCLVEIAQSIEIFEGTYDPIDLLLGVFAFIISININKFKNETKIKNC